MPLAGYQPESRVVQLSGGNSFSVRGLSLNDFAVLIRTHLPDLEGVFDLFQNVETLTAERLEPLAVSVISQAPGFSANVIALAAGEGDASDAERLPFPVQVKALLDIGELTFSEVGGVKKSLEMIAALLKKTELTPKLTKALKKKAA